MWKLASQCRNEQKCITYTGPGRSIKSYFILEHSNKNFTSKTHLECKLLWTWLAFTHCQWIAVCTNFRSSTLKCCKISQQQIIYHFRVNGQPPPKSISVFYGGWQPESDISYYRAKWASPHSIDGFSSRLKWTNIWGFQLYDCDSDAYLWPIGRRQRHKVKISLQQAPASGEYPSTFVLTLALRYSKTTSVLRIKCYKFYTFGLWYPSKHETLFSVSGDITWVSGSLTTLAQCFWIRQDMDANLSKCVRHS